MSIQERVAELIEEFTMFDDWMSKYEYLIDLGKELPLIEAVHKTDDNIIVGCQSQVWLQAEMQDNHVIFTADSDAIITKGIISLLIRVLSNLEPQEIIAADMSFIDKIGLKEHLSPTKAGYDPIIVDNFSNSDERIIKQIAQVATREIEVHNIDCTNEQQLSKLFLLETPISGVIHFAAYKAVGESVTNPMKYYHNNVGSLLTLIKVMRANKVRNLVFSSSCTVYGELSGKIAKETDILEPPISPYGNTKRICEDILRDAATSNSEIKSALLRYFNPIGAHPSGKLGELPIGTPNNLVPYITQTASGSREKVNVFGNNYPTRDGSCIRDYVHVLDIAKAHVDALSWLDIQQKTSLSEAINLGSGGGASVLELINAFETVNGVKVPYEIVDRRLGDIAEIYAQTDKAQALLNWAPGWSMQDALKHAWQWQQYLKENW